MMSEQIKSGFCRVCDSQQKVTRPRANHLLHFFLSVVTCGFWLVVWLGSAVQFGGWRCSKCGSSDVGHVK